MKGDLTVYHVHYGLFHFSFHEKIRFFNRRQYSGKYPADET